MKLAGLICYSLLMFISSSSVAYAYIDPGTTSVVFSSLVAIIAGVVSALSAVMIYFRSAVYKFVKTFRKVFPKSIDKPDKD